MQLTKAEVDRFWSKVGPPDGDGCRYWTAGTVNGYGTFHVRRRKYLAHRVAFLIVHGYWPEIGRHSCDHPGCCEPSHVLDGSRVDNEQDKIERGRFRNQNTDKEFCLRGHPYDETNTHIRPNGSRQCRPCNRDRMRVAREERSHSTR